MVGLLFAAAVVSLSLGEWADAIAIFAIVLLNGWIGFLQEDKADRSLALLKKLSAPMAKAHRDGTLAVIPAAQLVRGDRVDLEAGDSVPADARIVRSTRLEVDESSLTGESMPAAKDAGARWKEATALGDRTNMVYCGSVVTAGKGEAIVTATGMRTELGKIAGLLQREPPEITPLERRIAALGKALVGLCLGVVTVVFVTHALRRGDLVEAFFLSVSLAVAAVPEGLPAVITLGLALGVQRMVKRNVIVRRLSSVETLGSVNVICSDKTGTLTRNEMTVRSVWAGGQRYSVSGTGYMPRGEIRRLEQASSEAPGARVDTSSMPDLRLALLAAARCNHARLIHGGAGGAWSIVGDPTEGALLVAALKAGVVETAGELPILEEIPFDSERRSMRVTVREPDTGLRVYLKGAPEVVLSQSRAEQRGRETADLSAERRGEILEESARLAAGALRVIAVAYCDVGAVPTPSLEADEPAFVFAGLLGMMDPPREDAKEAVERCRSAGIRPVMITGDHPSTALAVARELGIAEASHQAVLGTELIRGDDGELAADVADAPVFARVTAEDKLRVVHALKARGDIVAMTGDGVNDAPAVKAADLGIAMGVNGTDVTRNASDMVLVDDNFASIVNAVEEGRCIYENLENVLLYLLSCNLGEVLLVFVASLAGWPPPLAPVHLLWINLVTDGLPALALAREPPARDVMSRKPRGSSQRLLSSEAARAVLIQGCIIGGTALAAFGAILAVDPDGVDRARSAAFNVLIFSELLRALAARSRRRTVFELGIASNLPLCGAIVASILLQLGVVALPALREVFATAPNRAWEWWLVAGLSLVPATCIEGWKLLRRLLHR